jgi:bacterioferritin-associated ferredoxin
MDTCRTHPCGTECPERFVCRCLQVTETELVEALITLELRTLKDIRRHTGAGDGCTACHRELKKYLERYGPSSALPICSVR